MPRANLLERTDAPVTRNMNYIRFNRIIPRNVRVRRAEGGASARSISITITSISPESPTYDLFHLIGTIAASRRPVTAFAADIYAISRSCVTRRADDVSQEIKGAKRPREADDPGVTRIPTHPLVRKHCALRTAWSPQDCPLVSRSGGGTKVRRRKFLAGTPRG